MTHLLKWHHKRVQFIEFIEKIIYRIYRKIAVDKFDKFDKRIQYFFTTILRKWKDASIKMKCCTSLLTADCLKYCIRDTNTVKTALKKCVFSNGPKKIKFFENFTKISS
jgi:hypothetical protein